MTLISPDDPPPPKRDDDRSGAILLLNLLGFGCLVWGLYYATSEPLLSDVLLDRSGTLATHRLLIGLTAVLAGVVFLAAAWRPRR